ncbi:MAG: cytochrome c [Pseudomonadota bacterium]
MARIDGGGSSIARMFVPVMLLALCLPAGCAGSKEEYRQRLMETGPPALHAVHNDRLRALMRRMNALLLERWHTELDIDEKRRRQTREIADVAEALQETVSDILATLPELSLEKSEQDLFRKLAGRLKSQAATLREQAAHNYVDAIPDSLDRITTTCNACHNAFRQLPAPNP